MNDIAPLPPPVRPHDAVEALVDDLTADLVQPAFSAHLPFGKKSALILIDPVQAYAAPDGALFTDSCAAALQNAGRLARACRVRGIPVIFSRLEYAAGGVDGGVYFRKNPALRIFLQDSPASAFCDTLPPLAGELVCARQYPSVFFGTSLVATLTSLGADTLIIAGFHTSDSVRASTVDAIQHGLIPFVVSDACADYDDEAHHRGLDEMGGRYAEIIDCAALLALLEKRD